MKNFVLDVDGVMNTGQFLYSVEGKMYKVFGPHDSDGLKMIKDKVKITFITADKRGFAITKKRITEDMGYELFLVSEESRYDFMKREFGFDNLIYMGDGYHDAPIIKEAAFGIAPISGRKEAINAANFVTESCAGDGAVLDACLKIKEMLFWTTNEIEDKKKEVKDLFDVTKIDTTNRYVFEEWGGNSDKVGSSVTTTQLQTTYVHKGVLTIEMSYERNLETFQLNEKQGFICMPGVQYKVVNVSSDFRALTTRSNVPEGFEVKEIVDDGLRKQEVPLVGWKKILNPKTVNKPWGGEIWISWTNLHVLKQIWMKAGNQCSLQYHVDKLETNYLVEGEADLIDGIEVDRNRPYQKIVQEVLALDLANYTNRKHPGDAWTSTPGIVHRVIAATDYVAYETSTPELDDVVRIKDDSGRMSGRIVQEHL
jgi:3-deoxy-D-manno-octulosonate 8-phosphate phosphatase (KDO 8-P phosphatase)